jgi:hypothetical protein
MFPYAPQITEVFERGFALEMYRVDQTTQRIHIRGGVQDLVEGILWGCGSFVSGITMLYD